MEVMKSKYRTVMIIEDNAIDLFIATKVIKNNNFAEKIINYDSAFDAFRHVQSVKEHSDLPDIIFVDLNLGDTTGFDFIELFLTLPKAIINAIKIFVVSSTVDTKDFERIKSYEIEIGFKGKYIDEKFLNSI